MINYFDVQSENKTLRGMKHISDNNEFLPIIIVHGFFSSNKIGPYRLYFDLAENFRKNGYTTFRIDLSGMGESDGNIRNISFKTHVNNLCDIINEVIKNTNSNKVHIVAHCFGCCVVLETLLKIFDTVGSITFLAPFVPSSQNYCRMLNINEYKEINNNAFFKYNGMLFDSSFIYSGYNLIDRDLLLLAQKKNLSAIFAQNDKLCLINDSIGWANNYSVIYDTINDADHNFLDCEARERLVCVVLEKLKNYERGE